MSREKGGRGLCSIEGEYKVTKIKAAVKLYGNGDPALAMVCEFEERAEELGHSSLVKEAARYAEKMGLQMQLEYPNPTCIKHNSGEVIIAEKLKAELRRCLEQKTWEAVQEAAWTELAGGTNLREKWRREPQLRGLLLVAKRLEKMPNTYSGGDVWDLRTVITYEAVCLPKNAHGYDGWCDVQAV